MAKMYSGRVFRCEEFSALDLNLYGGLSSALYEGEWLDVVDLLGDGRFWAEVVVREATRIARQLRIAVVRNVFGQGMITEDQALELLNAPLSPGGEPVYDDSGLLHAADALERIAGEAGEVG